MMMAGNWGQHAFLNTARKNDGLSNSITCINSGYNERCFNDGYHIGHHLKANRHWTEMPADFLATGTSTRAEGAIVFERLDFFLVSLSALGGRSAGRSRGATCASTAWSERTKRSIALLKARVRPVRSWPAEHIGEAQQA